MYGAMPGVPPAGLRAGALHHAVGRQSVGDRASTWCRTCAPRRRAGAFVAVIDPRRTPLARTADLHLAPRPGTDVVLALAMIDELHAPRRGRRRFSRARQRLRRARARRPRAVAGGARRRRSATSPPPTSRRLVDAYAAASPAVVRCGWGVERNRNGGQAARAILALPAVAGKFGVRGGGFTMSLSRAHPIDGERARPPRPGARPARARSTWCSSAAC